MASTIQVLLVFLLYCCLSLGQETMRARRAVPPPSAEDYGELVCCVSQTYKNTLFSQNLMHFWIYLALS